MVVNKALVAKRKIETGFLELAESILEISATKLYKVKYKTFAHEYFDRDKAVAFGHKKMRHIAEGVSAIDKSPVADSIKAEKRIQIFRCVEPAMPSTQIEALIEEILKDL